MFCIFLANKYVSGQSNEVLLNNILGLATDSTKNLKTSLSLPVDVRTVGW